MLIVSGEDLILVVIKRQMLQERCRHMFAVHADRATAITLDQQLAIRRPDESNGLALRFRAGAEHAARYAAAICRNSICVTPSRLKMDASFRSVAASNARRRSYSPSCMAIDSPEKECGHSRAESSLKAKTLR
jgi:hypothetical protein